MTEAVPRASFSNGKVRLGKRDTKGHFHSLVSLLRLFQKLDEEMRDSARKVSMDTMRMKKKKEGMQQEWKKEEEKEREIKEREQKVHDLNGACI